MNDRKRREKGNMEEANIPIPFNACNTLRDTTRTKNKYILYSVNKYISSLRIIFYFLGDALLWAADRHSRNERTVGWFTPDRGTDGASRLFRDTFSEALHLLELVVSRSSLSLGNAVCIVASASGVRE